MLRPAKTRISTPSRAMRAPTAAKVASTVSSMAARCGPSRPPSSNTRQLAAPSWTSAPTQWSGPVALLAHPAAARERMRAGSAFPVVIRRMAFLR